MPRYEELFERGKKVGEVERGKFYPETGYEKFWGKATDASGNDYEVSKRGMVEPVASLIGAAAGAGADAAVGAGAAGIGCGPFVLISMFAVGAFINGDLFIGFETYVGIAIFVVVAILAKVRKNDPINYYALLGVFSVCGFFWILLHFLSKVMCGFCTREDVLFTARGFSAFLIVPILLLFWMSGVWKK